MEESTWILEWKQWMVLTVPWSDVGGAEPGRESVLLYASTLIYTYIYASTLIAMKKYFRYLFPN